MTDTSLSTVYEHARAHAHTYEKGKAVIPVSGGADAESPTVADLPTAAMRACDAHGDEARRQMCAEVVATPPHLAEPCRPYFAEAGRKRPKRPHKLRIRVALYTGATRAQNGPTVCRA